MDAHLTFAAGRTFGPVPERSLAEPWIEPGYFAFKHPLVGDEESTREFAELVKDCKKVVDKAALRLDEFKDTSNVK